MRDTGALFLPVFRESISLHENYSSVSK